MNQVALITGGGKKRVGFHIARALAQRGYALALHYNTSSPEEALAELRGLGVRAEAFQADLSDEQATRAMLDRALASFGRCDVLVNAAAIWERKPLEAVQAADVRKHFEANTLGSFLTCQQVGLQMTRQAEGGVIINIGDWATVRPYTGYAAYFPSKGGVEVMTRTFAVELALRNPRVRVNAILPGPVMLPPDLPEAERNEAIAATLVKREGSPEQVAHAALFLIDNDFVTGVCLPVDGGRTVYAPGA
ncbi:MAG: SDR family oxidoreductase [Gemmataceae bacterium]